MDKQTEKTERPEWLVVCLAATSAALAYRLGCGIMRLIFFRLDMLTWNWVSWLSGWSFHIQLLIGLAFAIFISLRQHEILCKKPLKTSKAALIVFSALALWPGQIMTVTDLGILPLVY